MTAPRVADVRAWSRGRHVRLAVIAVAVVYALRFVRPVFEGVNMTLADANANASGVMLVLTWRELTMVLGGLIVVWALAAALPTIDALGRRSLNRRSAVSVVALLVPVVATSWVTAVTIPRLLPSYGAWETLGENGVPEARVYDPLTVYVSASLNVGTINTIIFLGFALILVALLGRTAGVAAAGALYLISLFTAADQVHLGLHVRMPYWLYPQPFDATPYVVYAITVFGLGVIAWWASRGGAVRLRWNTLRR